MTGPGVYRHRPTIIHALQYIEANVPALEEWLSEIWAGRFEFSDNQLRIDTAEGDRDCPAADGYWIVEGIRHEVYCIRDDIFRASYDELTNGEPVMTGRHNSACPPGETALTDQVRACVAEITAYWAQAAAAGETALTDEVRGRLADIGVPSSDLAIAYNSAVVSLLDARSLLYRAHALLMAIETVTTP